MQLTKGLVIKFIMVTAVLWIVLGLYGFTFGEILTTSVILTVASFLIGDLLILPRFGNTTATIGDFAFAFATIWVLGASFFGYMDGLVYIAFITAVAIAIGEALFHRFMERAIHADASRGVQPDLRHMQTEFSKDIEIGFPRDNQTRRHDREVEKSELTKEKDDFYNK